MIWIIKHVNGFEFQESFKSYNAADQWLRSNIIKGFNSIRDQYIIQTVD